MSFYHWLVILSACISFGGGFFYIRNTIHGQTKPNRVTWFLWALGPLIGTGAALSVHADVWAISRTFLAGFIPLMVVIASFVNPKSYWKLTLFDLLCGLFALLALVIWVFIHSPLLAILLAALADGLAAIPTIRKAWRFPETETGTLFLASQISVLLVLPSIPKWNIQNAAFPIYLLAVNSCLLIAVFRKRIF